MSDPKGLALPKSPPQTTLRACATAADELLSSPASGAPCVHWRLRIHETVAGTLELVHELYAPEPFLLAWRSDPLAPPLNVRVEGERAHIVAQPILHREGSPGALAVAKRFGLEGRVRVEEVLVRQGEALEAEGVLFDPSAAGGPYRASQGQAELYDATVRLPGGLGLRPALLPWALGTAAALLGAAGAATGIAKLWRLQLDHHISAEIGVAKTPHPLWP